MRDDQSESYAIRIFRVLVCPGLPTEFPRVTISLSPVVMSPRAKRQSMALFSSSSGGCSVGSNSIGKTPRNKVMEPKVSVFLDSPKIGMLERIRDIHSGVCPLSVRAIIAAVSV